jgi:hypothetical protein
VGAGGGPARARHADYFAGDRRRRLADLNAALADPRVLDAVWCLRGGYGAMRILDGVDYAALARRPRAPSSASPTSPRCTWRARRACRGW